METGGYFIPVSVKEVVLPNGNDVEVDPSQVHEKELYCCVSGKCGHCDGKLVELSDVHPACSALEWGETGEGRHITCEPREDIV